MSAINSASAFGNAFMQKYPEFEKEIIDLFGKLKNKMDLFIAEALIEIEEGKSEGKELELFMSSFNEM